MVQATELPDWAPLSPAPDPESNHPECPRCGCDFAPSTHEDVGSGLYCNTCWFFEPDGPLMQAHRELEAEYGPMGLRSPTVRAIVFDELRRIQNE